MFSSPYLYLYVISSALVFALGNTVRKINPANQMVVPFMGSVRLVTNVANYLLLVLCLFCAEHWWYAPIMWVFGYVLSILVPPTKVEMVLGYLAVICAPLCTLFAYLVLFDVI